MPKADEQVLVVPEAKVFETGNFNGVETDPVVVGNVLKNAGIYASYKPHGSLEGDSSLKQLIPYVVVKRNKDYFAYVRLAGGGESRLNGKLSIGVGGHMNEIRVSDPIVLGRTHGVSFTSTLKENMERELEEELEVSFNFKDCQYDYIGIINDGEDEVGAEHIGILVVVQIPPNGEVDVRETESLEGRWMSKTELESYDGPIEPWTKYALEVV